MVLPSSTSLLRKQGSSSEMISLVSLAKLLGLSMAFYPPVQIGSMSVLPLITDKYSKSNHSKHSPSSYYSQALQETLAHVFSCSHHNHFTVMYLCAVTICMEPMKKQVQRGSDLCEITQLASGGAGICAKTA